MRLSPRLKAILAFVEGQVLADIGTDHGYVPIIACLEKNISKAYACDVSPGPLKMADNNIKQYGLENRIFTRCGFGLRAIANEDDLEDLCVVIAGMGGMNIIEILSDPANDLNIKRLIVQPQRDIPAVKLALGNMGYNIIDEITAQDRNRLYTVIVAERGEL